ncbi:MAG TPA: DnaJ domain-containing protein [Gemmataceae bacterium]|nr:DnaJ domain-containing protein [Gemmataceae bacterium]
MARNYYELLGVSVNASAEELRAAYRRLVKLTHPDVSGANTTQQFQQVQQAWEVLRDPEQRRRYDATLRQAHAEPGIRPQPAPSRPRTAERPGGHQEVHLGLQVTRAEARQGGPLPVRLQVTVPCGACRGTGGSFAFLCSVCRGRGGKVRLRTVTLVIPPNLTDGETLTFDLHETGLPYTKLILHVQVF